MIELRGHTIHMTKKSKDITFKKIKINLILYDICMSQKAML